MKIRFEKIEFEVSPEFVEHVAKVYAELELMQARLRDARIQTETSNRTNLIATIASGVIQLLREVAASVTRDEDGDGDDNGDGVPGTEGGGGGEGSSQPA